VDPGRRRTGRPRSTGRPQASPIPSGATWRRDSVTEFQPDHSSVITAGETTIHYDRLVVALGLQLHFDDVRGLTDSLASGPVSSNYRVDLAFRTWELIRNLRSGTAVFIQPSGPIKCAGAPQKIAYLAADYWRRQGVLDDIRLVLVIPDLAMFKVPVWASVLEQVAARYGIEVRLSSEMISVDADPRRLVVADNAAGTKETLPFHLLHAVPPQAAPDAVRHSPLADPASPFGYVEVDKHTLVHPHYPNVFSPRRRGPPAHLQNRRRHPQAGTGRGSQPARRRGRSGAGAAIRRLHLLPAGHRPRQDAPRRVRLQPEAHTVIAAHRHNQGAPGHVAAQALRPTGPVLARDVEGTGMTAHPRAARPRHRPRAASRFT
jgi:NADPH-dependent 2,4-dienoyl-CoA reductase/sulfur reductase-like enzyme